MHFYLLVNSRFFDKTRSSKILIHSRKSESVGQWVSYSIRLSGYTAKRRNILERQGDRRCLATISTTYENLKFLRIRDVLKERSEYETTQKYAQRTCKKSRLYSDRLKTRLSSVLSRRFFHLVLNLLSP